ncbi:Predicted oxidoreductase, contains short-chain dehydrogenase (SDR) and DUF2520 domains [Rhodococcoides kroppenstedtii]|uniref:Predicted oxidoreductase, contains short-chain dehydrogenase (SDR) and DUF2520 domains n=1 Tax=Rhodococcoides kroppenstedtii TaxID=293050 RepID=A0A1I0TT81_9NOCA|nr:DUF2520 domain-containing protein [Rhodococcus kroppenstedtii]SFA54984.1 Predicted oxidoreductase, contains short-chain dehydrogenase (SDR) and DUF2520 domains [Rhodococcus kroppenstedtii]
MTTDPAPARLSVGIVSAGRVGTALGEALDRVGHVVFGCSAVSDASLARARTRLPDAAVLPAAEVAARSELLVLAVPDAELPALVQGLARTGAVSPGTLVLHTSGANGVGVLAPLAGNGVVTMAVHPAMTFSGKPEDTERLASACFGITAADEIGFAIAQSLVLEIGGEPVGVREDARTLYHAALAHGSNHLVTVVNDALDALRTALADTELTGQQPVESRPGGVAERVLAPLLSAALDNVLRSGPAALTGPVARGDADMVDAHLQALTAFDDDLAAGYRALSLRSAQRTGATHIVDRLRRQS